MHDFKVSHQWSKSAKMQRNDIDSIMQMLSGCATVREAPEDMDRLGVDYIATLRKGAEVYIDAKARREGASRYRGWLNEDPFLAIEIWSVMPGGKYNTQRSKVGWTLDEQKITDLILYTFHPTDSEICYLLPFQHLRIATRRFLKNWIARYGGRIQDNRNFESQAVFVPASEVILAIETTYSGIAPQPAEVVSDQYVLTQPTLF